MGGSPHSCVPLRKTEKILIALFLNCEIKRISRWKMIENKIIENRFGQTSFSPPFRPLYFHLAASWLRREGRGGRVGGGKRKRERSKYRESSYLEAMESSSRNENENEVYPYAYPGCIFLQRTSDPRMLDLLLSPPRARKADTFAFKFFVFPRDIICVWMYIC